MKIKFTINYKTNVGQILKITGSIPELGNNNADDAIKMFPVNGETGDWDCIIDVRDSVRHFSYKYFLEDTDSGIRLFEWGDDRDIEIDDLKAGKNIIISDLWKSSTNFDNIFDTSAFSENLFKRKYKRATNKQEAKQKKYQILFKIKNRRLNPGHSLAITGNIKELGNWDKSKVVLLNEKNFPFWEKNIGLQKITEPIVYKYCIVGTKTKEVIIFENEERILYPFKENILIRNDENFKYPGGNWKGAGVAIPVFALRSKQGHGVGEFLDLYYLIDWAVKTGLKLIQILPINDTVATHTWHDSYPYAAISVFALHPIYLNLSAIGKLSTKVTQEIIDEQRKLLNALTEIDYEAVMKIKSRFYKLIFDEQKTEFLQNPDFKKFFKANSYWLIPYASFSYLRDLFGTPDFTKWGRFSKPDEKILRELTSPKASHYDDIAVHYFIQYHLHKQLSEVAEYAREKGIIIKGDIPIGIFRHSVDAWTEPHLYNMDAQAGAPPDDFAELGQNWKFPTYNWDEMQKDNFKWWKNRLKKMATYFDAFRIDHILGFFRIWEIPKEQVQGILGYFNPSIPIYRSEFDEKGIGFDFIRYCTPYIRDYMLFPIFGEHTDFVKNTFLNQHEFGIYSVKEQFNTQRKIESYINISEDVTEAEAQRKSIIQNGMFKLLEEVLFIKYPHSEEETYIPRHSLFKTESFKALDDFHKQKIMELYNDYYYYRNEEFWRQQAMIKLPAIKKATNMLICGEDLGMIPKCVPQVMKDLNILSLEIQRMPKDSNKEFEHPNNYPYLSVATPSSHDTSTIRGWWEEDTSRSQRFFNQILGEWGNSPFYCEPWIVKKIIIQHLYSPSMWAIFPIQDLLGMDENLRRENPKDERINLPSNPNNYWKYWLHINLEDLLKENNFNTMIKNMLIDSNRFYNY